jgi:protein SCO1/2
VKRTRIYVLGAVGLIAAGALAVSLGFMLGRGDELHGTEVQNPPDLNALMLEHVDRGTVALADFESSLLLVFFGYTRCPDVCPLTLARVAKAYKDLGEPENVQLVMITIDPANDTPEVVQSYVSGFHPEFIGLGGPNTGIAQAARAFFIGYRQTVESHFNHTDAIAVLDSQRRLRYIYNQERVVRLTEDLPKLLLRRDF